MWIAKERAFWVVGTANNILRQESVLFKNCLKDTNFD